MSSVTGDGWLVLPKKIGFLVVVGGFMWLGNTIWSMSEFKTILRSDIERLKQSQQESRVRGDEVRARINALEGQRLEVSTRLTRLEEGQRIGNELLREIREEMRRTGGR